MSSERRRHARLVALNRALLRFERRLEDDLLAALRRLSWHVANRWSPGAEVMLDEWLTAFEREVHAAIRKTLLSASSAFSTETIRHIEDLLAQKAAREDAYRALTEWVSHHTFAQTLTLTQSIRDEVNKAIRISARKGGTNQQLAKRLAKALRGSVKAKQVLNKIARTQAHMASEMGSFLAARSMGMDIVKEWAALEDLRTRRSHAIADGQIQELEAPFEVGGEHLMHPGDPRGSAKQVVNCRCVSLYHPRINGKIIR